ncbi:4-(cytidine 5'-diphospho)-2-C-methyl-D-erythritol kinase [Bacteroidota bacterium]
MRTIFFYFYGMLLFPNTKINIGLNITEKRNDGFHNIESLLYPIGLSDILEVVEMSGSPGNSGYKFNQTGYKLDIPTEKNLCVKAYNLLSGYYDLPAVSIHLHKIVPTGSGLGGGSSDAVYILKVLNEMFFLDIQESKMIEFSSMLGSDCPFFVKNQASFVKGRGEIISNSDLKLSGLFLTLVIPGIHIDTKFAYSIVKPKKPDKSIEEIIKYPLSRWKGLLKNDFEKEIFRVSPEIGFIKQELYNMGAIYASMTGSGSSVYGIFKKRTDFGKIFSNYDVFTQKL